MLQANKEQFKFCPKIYIPNPVPKNHKLLRKTNKPSFKKSTVCAVAVKLWPDCTKPRTPNPVPPRPDHARKPLTQITFGLLLTWQQ
jgi:hypothetical protein